MKRPNNLRLRTVCLIVAVTVPELLAQSTVPNRTLLMAMAANAKRMTQYEWKQRVTVIRRGRPSEPIISQVSFDSSGQMQRTTISAPEQKQMGGIRGRIAANVKEDVKDIMQLVGEYNKPRQMAEAVQKAGISAGGGNTLTVQAAGLIKPKDSMTMLVDSTSHLAKHIDIKTTYEGAPMTVAQDYGPVPNGPNVMKQMKVAVPQKNLEVNVDSYDFVQKTAIARSPDVY